MSKHVLPWGRSQDVSEEGGGRMRSTGRWLGTVLLGLVMAACASSTNPPVRGDNPPSRPRCVSDLDRQPGTINRPLFYLFCIESP